MVFLDVIRGLAALCVLIEHTTEEVTHFSDKNWPGLFWTVRWFNLGRVGVAAFFLVSGFVIPYSLERANSLKVFWISRVFRLYPLFWFSILVVLAFHLLGNNEMMREYLHNWPLTLLVNLTMLEEFLHFHHAIGLYWTLTLELVFYFVFSAMFLVGVNKRTLLFGWLAAGGMFAAGLIEAATHKKLPVGQMALLSFAFLGTAIFRYYSGLITKNQIQLLTLGFILGCGVAFYFAFPAPWATHDTPEGEWSRFAMFSSYMGGIVLFGLIFMLRAREFSFPLRWLGAISYSIYLLHYPIWLALMPIPHHGLISGPLWQLTVFATACAVSSVTYLLIEKPGVELGKRLLHKPKPATELGKPTDIQTPVGPVAVVKD